MSKINPKLINEVFDDSILNKLPTNKNINKGVANAKKAQNPQFRKSLSDATQSVLKNPEKVKKRNEAARRAGETKRNSEEYQHLMTEVNRKKAENPEFKKNVSKGVKEKFQDPKYIEKYKKGRKNMNKENIIASNQSRDRLKQSDACRKGTLESLKNPKVIANREAGYAKKYKPCQQGTDGPIYPSRKHAAQALGIDPRVLGKWIKANKYGWKYL